MTRTILKEQGILSLPILQTFNNVTIIMLLHTFSIISLILIKRKGNYVMYAFKAEETQKQV